VRVGLELVFVERISGRGAVPVLTRVGGRFSLHATGVGLALLAHAPADVQEAVIVGELPAYTAFTITDGGRLRRELAEVRHRGYAVSDRMVTDDALSVAAPIHGPQGDVVAAVSLVTSAADARPHALAPVVRTVARQVSRALGAH
jgi:DNA-binding IclR family transcriptional regulator